MAKGEAQAGQSASAEAAEASLLDQIVDKGRFGGEAPARDRGRGLIRRFVEEVLEGTITIKPDTEAMLNARIAEIDRLISLQLNEIMHHPEMQRLEATWRGLKYLLSQSETGTMLKIKVLNVKKKELLKDLQKAPEFDQSALFKKVYEEEYGVFGGAPFGALLGDYEFGRSGQDIELLEKIAQVSAAAHAPFISGTSAEMFNLEDFTQLDSPRDLAKIFDTTEYAKWKAFRDADDARYVALTAPRMLLREPYGRANVPLEAFDYEEGVDGRHHQRYLWGNASWASAGAPRSAVSRAAASWKACRSTTSGPRRATRS
jgi:type VI secretion system protein ImpC